MALSKPIIANPTIRLLVGAVLISFSPVFVTLVDMGAAAIGFYRVFLGGAILLVIVRMRGDALIGRGGLALLAFAAVCYAADLWVWHQSIRWIGPGLATLLASFQVFVLTLVGVVFFKESAGWRLWVSVPLALLGLMLLVGVDWSILAPEKRAGVWLGLATAVFYSGYLLGLRQARFRASGRKAAADLTLVSLGSAVLLGLAVAGTGESLVLSSAWNATWLGVYALGSQVTGWLLITSSLPQVPASRAGLLLLLQPTLSFVWDMVFFARPMSVYEGTGAVVTLFAIWLGSHRGVVVPSRSDRIKH